MSGSLPPLTAHLNRTSTTTKTLDVVKTNCDSSPPYGVMSWVPLAIGALCQLMLASWTISDISINHPTEGKRKFDRIKYPDSLRATLLQISNQGYEAFSAAHLKMMKILYNSQEISQSLNEAEQMLQKATPENIRFIGQFVVMRMECAALAAKNCQTECSAVKKSLSELLNLIEEVVEAYSLPLNHQRAQFNKGQGLEMESELKINKLATTTLPIVLASPFGSSGSSVLPSMPRIAHPAAAAGCKILQQKIIEKASEEKEKTREVGLNGAMAQLSGRDISPIGVLENGIFIIKELINNWRELENTCESININFQTLEKNKAVDSCLTTSPVKSISEIIFSISPVTQMVSRIAKLYMDISSKHIMPAIGKMNQYSAVDSDEVREVSRRLMESTKAAHHAIEKIIEDERQRILKANKITQNNILKE